MVGEGKTGTVRCCGKASGALQQGHGSLLHPMLLQAGSGTALLQLGGTGDEGKL